ncbi:hypothetical protein T08_8977 [Trichinella sp. T8]|nr:hypothetical protein T08_8977 [Trichinella sp. T8]
MKMLHSLVTLCYGTYDFTKIRNHVDKYVIIKNYSQLMPLSLMTRTIAPLNACHCSNRAQDCFSMT